MHFPVGSLTAAFLNHSTTFECTAVGFHKTLFKSVMCWSVQPYLTQVLHCIASFKVWYISKIEPHHRCVQQNHLWCSRIALYPCSTQSGRFPRRADSQFRLAEQTRRLVEQSRAGVWPEAKLQLSDNPVTQVGYPQCHQYRVRSFLTGSATTLSSFIPRNLFNHNP